MTPATRRRVLTLASALALLIVVLPAPALAQCAMCRTAFDSPEGRKLIAAFRSGILFLLAAPVVTLITVGYLAIRGQRRLAIARDPDSRPQFEGPR